MVKRLLIVCAIISLISANLFAQYDMKAPLPLDPQVRTGKLANGLTYYVRHNSRTQRESKPLYHPKRGGDLGKVIRMVCPLLEHMASTEPNTSPAEKGS